MSPTLPSDTSVNLADSLREANQNLVLASLRAQDMQNRAETSVARQTEFLSMLAHELRNPLAPIAMASEMLAHIADAHPQLPHIHQVISRQVVHMKRLLEDLLDASRVTSGKVNLQTSRLALADIVESAAEICQPSLSKNRQTLAVQLPPQPVFIDGDAVRLAQVFSNLLMNASKFSPADAVICLLARAESSTVSVSVTDQGAGIESSLQPFVFDLFTQSARTLERSEGGLGIGLALVHGLVELHHGTVSVHSAGAGQGSEFTVVLPLAEALAPAALAPVVQAASAAGVQRILLVEDSVDANETLNLCLTFLGHTVESAFDGPSGLAMAAAGNYDIVVCDIGLPGMDGYDVVAGIRQLPLGQQPYCIALTGYDQQQYRLNAVGSGFDNYLVKPVDLGQLTTVIASASTATFTLAAAGHR